MFTKNRVNYWSCSKVADWIRGEKKPYALTLEDWDDWKNKQSLKRPIRFYIADTLLNKLQNFLYFPWDIYVNIRHYVSNRFIYKIHYLHTGLKAGNYYDLDHRILHGLFNELVNYVEQDLAWMNQWSKKNKKIRERSAQDGLEYLDWSIDIKDDEGTPTKQAESAKEILELYNWWKNYPNRPDPMQQSGWSDLCEKNKNEVDPNLKDKVFNDLQIIEEQQEQEETDMLIRLIKIRKSLWT